MKSIEDGAIREVEEETGVKNLTIPSFLQQTYHVFQRKGRVQAQGDLLV